MATFQDLENSAINLPEVTLEPHFEKISFRVKKKIFITFDEQKMTATFKLSLSEQTFFSQHNGIAPVPNKWGEQGWTVVEVEQLDAQNLHSLVLSAYKTVAPKKLVELISGKVV